MKKIVSIMLCAVMVVFAVLPCFAADAPTLTKAGDKTPFEAGNYVITKNFLDYTDDQPELFDNGPHWTQYGRPNYTVAGFHASSYGYMTLWGSNGYNGTDDVWGEKTFQVKFNAPAEGDYSFAVVMGCGGAAGEYVPVRIDDGETYKLILDGIWTNDGTGQPTPFTYYGMNNIHLTEGEHTFHIAKVVGTETTQYYFGFKYTSDVLTAENLTRTTTLPSEFENAKFVSIGAEGKRDNPNTEINVYGVDTGVDLYPEGDALHGSAALNENVTYKFVINADSAGEYDFCFKVSSGGAAGNGLGSIKVNGEDSGYTAVSPGGSYPWKTHEFFATMAATLEKGENIIEIVKVPDVTTYYHGFYYKRAIAYMSDTKSMPTQFAAATYVAPYEMDENGDPVFEGTVINRFDQEANVGKVSPNMAVTPMTDSVVLYSLTFDHGVYPADHAIYGALGMQYGHAYRFTVNVEKSGVYAFATAFAGGAGQYDVSLTVDGVEGEWIATTVDYAGWASVDYFSGMEVKLTEGTHVIEVKQRENAGAFLKGLWYVFLYSDEDVEGGDADGIYTGDIAVLPNTNATVPGDALGQPNVNAINPVDAPAANMGEVSASAPAASVAAPAPKQPYVPARKPAAPGRPGNHVSTPARPA